MGIYDTLNDRQKEAVFCTEGPLLLLAGAGSGKTRVLTHRIAYLIEEKGINPWNICAITFTNKAAEEMRERVDRLVGTGAESIWVATFHSTCVRILRRHISLLGYESQFSIYDGDDQKTVVKHALKAVQADPKQYPERVVMKVISKAKEEMKDPETFLNEAGSDYRQKTLGKIYQSYQKILKKNNAVDFDDLLVLTVRLFETNPEVCEEYQRRFRYIHVDEYQDTNGVQFQLVRLLAGSGQNVCVVGDDDQSIYKFRGADIRNILDFEKVFPRARVIKLEQNYRSTPNILDTANAVIKNNRGRKEKKLWTAKKEGNVVKFTLYEDGRSEGEGVVSEIREAVATGKRQYRDCAVLYRTNAQSRSFEEACVQKNVPYRIVGGINFYQRAEIKDMLAYLKTIANGADDLAVARIINVPRRGIGETTISTLADFAARENISLFAACARAEEVPGLQRSAAKVHNFVNTISVFRAQSSYLDVEELLEAVLEATGYREELNKLAEEVAESKLQNVEELLNKAAEFEGGEGDRSLQAFLEQVALVADIDSLNGDEDRILLMTLHGAKGLEFPKVYLAGMEEGLFPSSMSVMEPEDLEEERRLFYVGVTRAMEELTLTAAKKRMIHGETKMLRISRFVDEVPPYLLDKKLDHPFRGGLQGPRGTVGIGKALPAGKGGISSGVSFAPGPGFGRPVPMQKVESLSYGVGDRVQHVKFGAGTVTHIENKPKDYEITVDFDRAGQKKLLAAFANLTKKD